MRTKQLSIFLENKTGRLANITKMLGDAGINILALSLADTSDFGILRIIVDDFERAQSLLKTSNVVSKLSEVTAVEVADKPGGLAKLLETLDGNGVNVEYMYAFSESKTGRAALIFRFDDPETAVKCLSEAGVNVFSEFDLAGRS